MSHHVRMCLLLIGIFAAIAIIVFLSGCCKPCMVNSGVVDAEIPVYLKPEPPQMLMDEFVNKCKERLCWYAPSHPESVVCLSEHTAPYLEQLMMDMKNRHEAWKAWSKQE